MREFRIEENYLIDDVYYSYSNMYELENNIQKIINQKIQEKYENYEIQELIDIINDIHKSPEKFKTKNLKNKKIN